MKPVPVVAPVAGSRTAWLDQQRDCLRRIVHGDDLNVVLLDWLQWAETNFAPGRLSAWLLDPPGLELALIAPAKANETTPIRIPADALTSYATTIEDRWLDAAAPFETGAAIMPILGLDATPIGLLMLHGSGPRSPDAGQGALIAHTIALVTERFRANRTLQDRQDELARVQRIGRVGGVEVDLRHGFHNRRSPEYLSIHGLPPSAANETHDDWVRRIHPDDRSKTEHQFKDAIRAGIVDYNSEYRIIRPSDGEIRWIMVHARIERDDDGQPLRLVGAHIDVTDRMHAQQTLRESEERFRLIADSAPVPIWVTKMDRQRAFANQAYLDFLGLPYDEALAFDWRKILHPDDLPRILQEQLAGEASLKPFTLEARYRRADGQWRWIMSESQPRWDADGNHIGFIGVAHDITTNKDAHLQTEAQLDRAREELFQSQKMEAIGQLTGGIAHDFNNLLMAVLGSVDMVRKRLPADSPLHRFLDNATAGAERGAALTQRMLAFARRQDLNPVAIDLRHLVDGMTDLLRSSLGPLYRVETDFAHDLGLVQADPQQLELAVLNLAVNARDAMPRGGAVRIEARNERPAPDWPLMACISVKDAGSGMDASTLARAMEPFFTTKGIGKGTGLGLSMVHGMVEQLGGKITLESTPGEGTNVVMFLPLAKAADLLKPQVITMDETEPKDSTPRVVLAVDDDPLVLLNTVAMLEDLGHVVFEAHSAAKGLEILGREPSIDLVISDQAMPNMTGAELAKAVLDRQPNIQFVIATGYAELAEDTPPGVIKLGKPFSEDELAHIIRTVGSKSDG